jgi:FKBP-type peptidyl-prolyl cis-trans isomerase
MVKLNGQTARDLFEGCFGFMAAGDSATYFIPVDSLFKGAPEGSRPAFLPKGSDVKFSVSVQSVENEKAMLSRLDGEIEKFVKTESSKKFLKQPNGLHISMTTMGQGITPVAGDTVSVNYRGRVMGGTEIFDESYSRGQPFQFVLGQGQVIRGWDEGIAMLTEGSEATILVPFALGYGEAGSPPAIPPYTSLVFDVKLEKVKKGKGLVAPPAMPPMPEMQEIPR